MVTRYQEEGHLHVITFSCYRREPTLPPFYQLFEEKLEQTRRRDHFDVHGYVLMPEPVHLLLGEPEAEPLAKALQSLKLSVSKQIGGKQFGQPRYYDFNVFTARKRVEKLNYMHRSLVTRGLVAQAGRLAPLQLLPLPHWRPPLHPPPSLPHTLNPSS